MLSDSSNIGKAMNVAMNSNVKPSSEKKSQKADTSDRKNLENVKSLVKSQGKAKKNSSMNEVDYEDEQIDNESELFDLEEVDEEMKAEEESSSGSLDHDVMDLLNKKYPNNKDVNILKSKLKEFFDSGRHFDDLEDDIQFQIKVIFSEKDHDQLD